MLAGFGDDDRLANYSSGFPDDWKSVFLDWRQSKEDVLWSLLMFVFYFVHYLALSLSFFSLGFRLSPSYHDPWPYLILIIRVDGPLFCWPPHPLQRHSPTHSAGYPTPQKFECMRHTRSFVT
jgi:hypothetical protein